MERIKSKEISDFFDKILNYTPEQQEIINSYVDKPIPNVYLGRTITMSQDDINAFSTKAGIETQIDGLSCGVGIVFYMEVKGSTLNINRVAVEIER